MNTISVTLTDIKVIFRQLEQVRVALSESNFAFRSLGIITGGAALTLHLCFALRVSTTLTGDMTEYHAIAIHIIRHQYYGIYAKPDAYVTPIYPLFITCIYLALHFLFGISFSGGSDIVRSFYLVQQIITLTIPLFCYILAFRISGRWSGLAAAMLSVMYLPNNFIGSMMLTEALYIPLLLALLILLDIFLRGESTVASATLGVIYGLTVLTRPTAGIILPVTLVLYFVVNRQSDHLIRKLFRHVSPLLLGTVIVILPWIIRNAIALHQFVPLSTEGANPLLLGASPNFDLTQYTLMTLAHESHKTLSSFTMQYIENGFEYHFFKYLIWYTIGRFPDYFLSPWILWWWANTATFVNFHRVIVFMGLITTAIACSKSRLRFIGVNVTILLIVQWPFQPIVRYVYPIIVVWCALIPITLGHKATSSPSNQ